MIGSTLVELIDHPVAPVVGVSTYLVVIALLKFLLPTRKEERTVKGSSKNEKKENDYITFFHNFILTIESAVLFIGITNGILTIIQRDGYFQYYCDPNRQVTTTPWDGLYIWARAYYWSKYHELFDTVVLCMRRKPLTFLHIFHHCVMPFVCNYALYPFLVGPSSLAGLLNTFVHVLMYSYFSLSAIGYTTPYRQYITTMQITQFVIILFHCIPWLYYYTQGVSCNGSLYGWLWLFGPVSAIMCFFANFYIQQFIKKNTKQA